MGTAASMRFGNGNSSSDAITISTATTLYYEIPLSVDFTGNTTTSPIVITNNGEGMLSLCNIKMTYSDGTSAAAAVTMNEESAMAAKATAFRLAALTPDDGAQFTPEKNAEAESVPEELVYGEAVELTFTTTADTARLTVNGEDAELVGEENGVKTWKFIYTAGDKSGVETLTLTAYDANGTAAEDTTVEITVKSRFQKFFDNLVKFISMIVEAVKKVYAL